MPHKLLTALKDKAGLNQTTAGEWLGDVGNRDFLERFAASVRTQQGIDLADVHSVPSVFAQPILFAQALSDPSHPGRKDVVSQWRGLLAVFALQSWYGYSIDYRLFPIQQPAAGARTRVGDVPAGGLHLNAMLWSMRPEPRDHWKTLRLIKVAGTVVGAISPWTWVFTPATPWTPADPVNTDHPLPWMDTKTGRLVDPLKIFAEPGKKSIELTFIYQWIQRIRAEAILNQGLLPPALTDSQSTVLEGLRLWADGDANAPNEEKLATYMDTSLPVSIAGLQTINPQAVDPQAGLIGLIGNFLRAALAPAPVPGAPPLTGGAMQKGDCWLKPTRPGLPRTIVLNREGMAPLTRLDDEAFPFNVDLSKEKLPHSRGARFMTKAPKMHMRNWLVASELFFPIKLAHLDMTEQALWPNAHPEDKLYSLPLTPEFFEYFNPQDVFTYQDANGDIRPILTIQIEGSGNAKLLRARLDLPLESGGVFPLEKTFSLAESSLADTGDSTPGFALWPDFQSESWPHNLAGYRGPIATPLFQAAPLFPGGRVEVFSKVAQGGNSESEVRIWECSEPPVGFALMSGGLPAGVLLRRPSYPPIEIATRRSWRVSVDFGTANTMICYEEDGGENPVALNLMPRLVQLNEGPNAENLKHAVAPPETVSSPFRTLCYGRYITKLVNGAGITCDSYTPASVFLDTEEDHRRLVSNLKWGNNTKPLTEYLHSLVRLIVTEARAAGVQQVNIKWTFPLSLAVAPKNAMRNFWNAVAGTFSGGGVTVSAGDPSDRDTKGIKRPSISESEGACRCLVGTSAAPGGGGLCVVLDIGGGSTDFAFWKGGNLLDYFSCKLAANDVLRGDWHSIYPQFPSEIYFLSVGAPLPPGFSPLGNPLPSGDFDQRNKMEIWINHVLSLSKDQHGLPFREENQGWINHPVVKRIFSTERANQPLLLSIRSTAFMMLVGLAYFAGLRARDFADQLVVKDIKLTLTGRGSSICGWVQNEASHITDMLRECFLRGYQRDRETNDKPEMRVFGAALERLDLPRLKTEVGLGALKPAIGSAVVNEVPVFGELNWTRRGGAAPLNWNDRISLEETRDLVPPNQNVTDCFVHGYLGLIRSYQEPLGLDKRLKDLQVDWAQVGDLIVDHQNRSGITQPIFALEVRALMAQYFRLCANTIPAAANRG